MGTDRLSIAILTQYFYPEVPGTAQISTDLAVGLAEAGFDVHVYTGQPAYRGSRPLPRYEEYRGVHIHRAYSRRLSRSRLSASGHTGRLLSGFTVATVTLLKMIARRKPRAVLVDSTSPFLLLVAWLLRKLRRVPYVCVVHDVYPEIAVELGIVRPGSVAERVWRAVYRRVYAASSKIVVLGPRMMEVVQRGLTASSEDRCVVIPNWADGDAIMPVPAGENPLRQKLGLVDKLVVLYSGNMGPAHDMRTVVDGAERLQHLQDVQFLFIGDGGSREWVSSTIERKKLANIRMEPYQPEGALPYSLTCGDISLVTQQRGMEGLSVPSKVYSSLAAGLAIVGVVGEGSEVGDIVEEHECGFRVSQGDVDGLVRAIERLYGDRGLLEQMKRRARGCFEANYARQNAIDRYLAVVREVTSSTEVDRRVEASA